MMLPVVLSVCVPIVLLHAILLVLNRRSGRAAGYRDPAGTDENLRKSEEKVRLLLNSTAEAIYGIDLHGDCTFVNPSCMRMLGYTGAEQLLGRNMHRVIHHSFSDGRPMPVEDCRIYRAYREGERVHTDDEVLWKADGSCFPVEYWSYPQIEDGRVCGAVVTFIDIAERRKTELELKESRSRFQSLVETLYDWIWEVDVEGIYTYVSPQIRNILGYDPEEILGRTPFDLMPQEEADRLSKQFETIIRDRLPITAIENINIHKDGRLLVMETNGRPFYDPDGNLRGYRGTDRDITERKRAEERIRHMANYDYLTDLPTMRLARDRFSMAVNLARRYREMAAVLFIDLDGFKTVNDTFGHEAGDSVLKRIAERLVSGMRSTNTVARVGGDEFLLIAAELHSPENAALIAEKALSLISQPIDIDGKEIAVGASIGIAMYPGDGEDIDTLIRNADKAMYSIKNSCRNGFCFANAGRERSEGTE